jgi:hypothetical protein
LRSFICGAPLLVLALAACDSRTSTPLPVVLQQIIRDAHTPLEKAAALLPWAAETVVVGTPNLPNDDAATLLPIFRARTGGGSCALFATFYQDLLARVGIPAITVNIGLPNTPTTHVTTLVWDRGTFYVFDPTYNGRFLDSSGHDVPLPVILSDASLVIQETATRRGVVYPIGDVVDPKCLNVRQASPTIVTCDMVVPAHAAVVDAKINGLSGDFVGALLRTRVLAVGSSTPQQRAALVEMLRNAGIPNDVS